MEILITTKIRIIFKLKNKINKSLTKMEMSDKKGDWDYRGSKYTRAFAEKNYWQNKDDTPSNR